MGQRPERGARAREGRTVRAGCWAGLKFWPANRTEGIQEIQRFLWGGLQRGLCCGLEQRLLAATQQQCKSLPDTVPYCQCIHAGCLQYCMNVTQQQWKSLSGTVTISCAVSLHPFAPVFPCPWPSEPPARAAGDHHQQRRQGALGRGPRRCIPAPPLHTHARPQPQLGATGRGTAQGTR